MTIPDLLNNLTSAQCAILYNSLMENGNLSRAQDDINPANKCSKAANVVREYMIDRFGLRVAIAAIFAHS